MTARSSLFRTLSSARPTTRTLITLSAPATTQRIRPSTINATAIRFRSESSSSWTESFFGSSKQKYAPGEFAKDPIITYDELLPITEQPSDDVLLIDVREPDEVQNGMIPSAVSLPLRDMKDALGGTGEGDFYEKFSFPKPLPTQNLIFYCRSGKRSAAAAEIAAERGYKSVRNYTGSWLDWDRKSKGKEEDEDYNDDGTARG